MARTYAELEQMTLEELMEAYDAKAGNTSIGLGFLREEIFRREQRSAQRAT